MWTHEDGLIAERTAPDTPDQNGPSERSGGIITSKARRLRIDAKLPEDLWPECIRAAVYLMNRSPSKTLGWMTPIEKLGKLLGIEVPRPNLFQVKIYGCRSYARILNLPKKRKVAARALIGGSEFGFHRDKRSLGQGMLLLMRTSFMIQGFHS